ncbi:hypothetical protein L3C95_16300 [Chitinophaga filiformis]|uniref:hypothetical protein n=1 Tax=Chitinophaga filiformis TaxID=104663 RepID=UPI001F37DA7E|nr:hypothetical protein [Chitinophaga filiformis]MCF6404460.1 hypothetical protein [Chitinophaga filiformis]
MTAITYTNTRSTVPNFTKDVHTRHPRGYAYETPTHFVHFYGKEAPYYTISIGLTAIERKNGPLTDWVERTFGATDIRPMSTNVGEVTDAIWRPGLHRELECFQALSIIESEKRNCEQSITLLVNRLEELFYYIYPDRSGLAAYSHKTRELLILACTEVENFWKYYISKAAVAPLGKYYTTKDYVRLMDALFLRDYRFRLDTYPSIQSISPFSNWDQSQPTTSLRWYDAYNKVKHDRDQNFSLATLENCIQSVVANLVIYAVRFGSQALSEQKNKFSTLFNEHFKCELINSDPTTFYLTKINLPSNTRTDLTIIDSACNRLDTPFSINKLVI